jgi:hypothetical protein
MLRRLLCTVVVSVACVLAFASVASADPCCHNNGSNCNPSGGTTTDGNGNGNGGGVGNQCQLAPEAPLALIFPLAAIAVIGGYVLLTRRRRAADL